MKRIAFFFWLLTSSGWTWCTLAATPIQHLMRPIWGEPTLQTLDLRGGESAMSAFTGYIQSTNVTSFTAILWLKIASYPDDMPDGGILLDSTFTVDSARATSEGGPGLDDLLHDAYLVTPIPLSSGGTWQAACLPSEYDCPAALSAKWGHGCYCVNMTSDTPLTLTVGGAELFVPATNCMVRNILAVSADRTVTIAAGRADACINFGIAEMPLLQFVDAGDSSNSTGGSSADTDIAKGGPTSTEWRMITVRGRIEGASGVGQTDTYNATNHFDNVTSATSPLSHPRSTFARDSRVRLTLASIYGPVPNGSDTLQVKFFGGKLLRGWLTDGEVEHLRDLDAAELRRRGEIP